MNKRLLFTVLLLLSVQLAFAKHVEEEDAKRIGLAFLKANTLLQITSADLETAYKEKPNSSIINTEIDQVVFFYVFNVGTEGFVIVSGDDNVFPILGYSNEGNFHPLTIPQNAAKWLEEYKNQIRHVIDSNISATQEIQSEWAKYADGNNQNQGGDRDVAPLLQTQWNQAPFYNALCPGGSVTGCVATAMAQIMKYWNHPATGSGFHSYNHQTYGTLSANYGSTTYQWGSMPNAVNSSNNAVATLMYQVGVSVDMQYSPEVSGAYVIQNSPTPQACSEYAFKTYFGYKPTLQGVERANYNQTQWINLLKTELDASRPVLYAGFGSGGGHAFVCDGYDNNSFFHFNWGWGGAYDGYFQINALNPSGTGTGGGSGGYNSGHQAVIGIEPPATAQTYNMGLYNYVMPSANTINYGQSFNVTTNISNNGTNTFNGDYCAAVFDSQYNFIDYVQTLSSYTLQGGYAYTNNLVFSSSGLFSMLPGTYYIGIFYRPTGGNWVQVTNSGSYTNMVEMNVINPSNIELYSSMNISPGTTLIQGQSISVNLNLTNVGAYTFYGQYGLGLYNLDGTLAQTIGVINETNGLPSGYAYLSPYLTFSNSAITVEPGTYLLAVQHNFNNSNWQLTGSSNFQNPITVTVQTPTLSPDQYENNNTTAQAYTLPISFSNNTATKNTVGSNLHTGTDNDYYKINLPSGYNYSITARLHDSYNSGNGNTYTVDGLFSYSTDGANWSNTYDDILAGSIIIENGGTTYFRVAPYFAGEVGTYLLDMTINRTVNSVIVEDINDNNTVELYPNPAQDYSTIKLSGSMDNPEIISIYNVQGQQVFITPAVLSKEVYQISLQDLSAGLYYVKVNSGSKSVTKKLIVRK